MPGFLLKAKGVVTKGLNASKKALLAKKAGSAVAQDEDGNAVSNLVGVAITVLKVLAVIIIVVVLIALILLYLVISYPLAIASVWIGGSLNASGGSGSSGGNVAVGEAAQIEGEDARIEWLYDGNGVPQTEAENEKYLETFDVEYLDGDGNIQTFSLTMHTKLKTEVQAIFQEMINIGFPIEWSSGGGSIRGWNTDTGYSGNFFQSAHCYGHAVDINVAANPCAQCGVGSESDYQPGVDPYSVTEEVVNIWKKHGFYWGGDWNSPKDYMHFSYFNH